MWPSLSYDQLLCACHQIQTLRNLQTESQARSGSTVGQRQDIGGRITRNRLTVSSSASTCVSGWGWECVCLFVCVCVCVCVCVHVCIHVCVQKKWDWLLLLSLLPFPPVLDSGSAKDWLHWAEQDYGFNWRLFQCFFNDDPWLQDYEHYLVFLLAERDRAVQPG